MTANDIYWGYLFFIGQCAIDDVEDDLLTVWLVGKGDVVEAYALSAAILFKIV